MEIYKIKKTVSGNCECGNCRKRQQGLKDQPFTVWHKAENEKRGHQEPMCSEKCCIEWIERRKANNEQS